MQGSFSFQKGEDIKNLKVPVTVPKLASVKLDGIRCGVLDKDPLMKSLKRVPNHHIFEVMRKESLQGLDGELLVGPANDSQVYNKTWSGVSAHKGSPDFQFYVFDDFTDPRLPLDDRLHRLNSRKLPSFVTVVEQWLVGSQVEVDTEYDTALLAGFEGLMLRNRTATYKYGRSTLKSQDMLKMKPHLDGEAVVESLIQAMENTNEKFIDTDGYYARSTHQAGMVPKAMIGGFNVRDVVTGLRFAIGAGKLNHDQRREIWANPAIALGRIAKYTHMGVGAKDVPRHGRWIAWRMPEDMNGDEANLLAA